MSYESALEELVQFYVRNRNDGASMTQLLLKKTDGNRLVKEVRQLAADFETFALSMDYRARARFDGYMKPVLGEDGKFTLTTADRHSSVYVYDLTPNRVTFKDAAAIVQEFLPSWVKLAKVDRDSKLLTFTTDKGPIFQSAVKKHIDYYGNPARLNRDGELGGANVSDIITSAELLTSKSREYLRKALKDRQQTVTPVSTAKPVRSGVGNLSTHLDRIRKDRYTADLFVPTLDVAPHGVVSSRTWGIEVETAGARGASTPAGWQAKGDGSLSSAYTKEWWDAEQLRLSGHDVPVFDEEAALAAIDVTATLTAEEGACADHCTMCQSEENRRRLRLLNAREQFARDNPLPSGLEPWESRNTREDCREFVSPILHSFHSKGLEKLVGYLSTQPQNDTAGVHVHVGVDDLSARQIGSLTYGYNMIEPLLVASYKREKRDYCKDRSPSELRQIAKQSKTAKRIQDISAGDRYVTLNLQAINSHHTVEFRAMGPVYDYEYLIRWAYFCREMVNAAKNGAQPKDWNGVRDFKSLKAFMVKWGSETVDDSLSEITEAEIQKAYDKNNANISNSVYASVGGEI